MSRPVLTPWFPPHIKPVRVGNYQASVKPRHSAQLYRWDGRYWYFLFENGDQSICFWQGKYWRGLAEKP